MPRLVMSRGYFLLSLPELTLTYVLWLKKNDNIPTITPW